MMSGSLVKLVSSFESMHWPAEVVSHVELLTVFELWAGETLGLKTQYLTKERSPNFCVPAVPGMEIRQSCRFLGSMTKGLMDLPG